ncbi:hypothetical protein Golax_014475, partial [Gossypium laxum]|nr:hypothetical protein [Gossypium laxum]
MGENFDGDMVVNSTPVPGFSWKDMLLKRGSSGSMTLSSNSEILDGDDFEFTERDIVRSNVNGIQIIDFLEQIWYLLVKDIDTTVVLVDDRFQMIEFEALPVICFTYDRYGHVKCSCPLKIVNSNLPGGKENDLIPSIENANTATTKNPFDPWIIVERRSRLQLKDLGDRFQQGEFLRNLKGKGVGPRHEKVGVGSDDPLLIDQMVSIGLYNSKVISSLKDNGAKNRIGGLALEKSI